MKSSAKIAAILLLPAALAACAGSDEGRGISFTDDRGVANQPFPANYKSEIISFMRTYLNNPAGVRDAGMAEPVQRVVGGRLRYVSCLRFTPAIPAATTLSRVSARFNLSTAGSTALSKTPASPAPARSMRRFPNWKRCRASENRPGVSRQPAPNVAKKVNETRSLFGEV